MRRREQQQSGNRSPNAERQRRFWKEEDLGWPLCTSHRGHCPDGSRSGSRRNFFEKLNSIEYLMWMNIFGRQLDEWWRFGGWIPKAIPPKLKMKQRRKTKYLSTWENRKFYRKAITAHLQWSHYEQYTGSLYCNIIISRGGPGRIGNVSGWDVVERRKEN